MSKHINVQYYINRANPLEKGIYYNGRFYKTARGAAEAIAYDSRWRTFTDGAIFETRPDAPNEYTKRMARRVRAILEDKDPRTQVK